MVNHFNIPPILQEFDQFINTCKKMNEDLALAAGRLTTLETELAKEKAERRNLHHNSHRKIQELTTQNESIRSNLEKTLKNHQDEANQIRGMLVASQNEHKSVLKIIQEELDRTKSALRTETQIKTDTGAELKTLRGEHESLQDSKIKDAESLRRTSANLKALTDELDRLKINHKKTEEDYARAIQNAGQIEQTLQARGGEYQKKIQAAEAGVKAEAESKHWLNQMLIKLQKEFEQLGKQLQREQETSKGLKAAIVAGDHKAKESREFQMSEQALRSRDDEVIRLQEQLIKTKRALQDTDEARKSAQAIANQARSELETARHEIEQLRTEHPLRTLLMNKEIEIHEITNQLSELADNHPDRQDLAGLLDSAVQQRAYFEQLLNDTRPDSADTSTNRHNLHFF